MPGPRQPLKVIEGNGRKHLTKKEKYEREQSEVKPKSKPKFVQAPSWLPEQLKKDFSAISKQLIELEIFTKLDRDTLGMYLIARSQYLQATAELQTHLQRRDSEGAADWAGIQDKFFKQARACANDLGLTVTSRCRLVLPEKKKEEDEDPMDQLFARRYG